MVVAQWRRWRRAALGLALGLALGAATAGSAAGSAAAAAHAQLFAERSVAELVGWPWPQNGPRDDMFRLHPSRARACEEECFGASRAARRRAEGVGATWLEDDGLFDGPDDGDEDDLDDAQEVLVAGHEAAQDELSAAEESVPGSVQDRVERAWACEEACGALERLDRSAALEILNDNRGRRLVLWESKAFSDLAHCRRALRELAATAAAARGPLVAAYLYSYDGWAPADAAVRMWWTKQHDGNKLQSFQATPAAFGGWGRTTLSLVHGGTIVWDVFDFVHTARHRQLVADGDGERWREAVSGDALERFAANRDLPGALAQAASGQETLLPFQACVSLAREVLHVHGRFESVLAGASETDLDALAHYCDDPPEHGDDDADSVGASHDMDYERFRLMAQDMGLVRAKHTMRGSMHRAWRRSLLFLRDQDHGTSNVLLLANLVPVFEGGASGGLGVGERHDALMLSLCYWNASIADRQVEARFQSRGGPRVRVNADVLLTIVPCGDTTAAAVLKCIKMVLADALASAEDLLSATWAPQVGAVLFGRGFVDEPRFAELEPFWLKQETEQDFPPAEESDKLATEEQARNRKPSKIIYKDEL